MSETADTVTGAEWRAGAAAQWGQHGFPDQVRGPGPGAVQCGAGARAGQWSPVHHQDSVRAATASTEVRHSYSCHSRVEILMLYVIADPGE